MESVRTGKRSAAHSLARPKSVARIENHRHLPRTARGSLLRRNVLNAWTRTKIAQNIKRKTKTAGPNSPGRNNTREMAVILRRLFTHAPGHQPGLVLFRGMAVNDVGKVRLRENGPTSWTNNPKISRIFSKKTNQPGLVLALTLGPNTPFIKIKKNAGLRWSRLGEHILPPGNFQIKNKNNSIGAWRVEFKPNQRYLRPWTFY